MEQISIVPQARLVNTYVACLLASCGEIIGEKVEGTLACFLRSDGDQLAELVYGSLPGSKSVSTPLSHSCPTTAPISRASRRRPSASSWAGAALIRRPAWRGARSAFSRSDSLSEAARRSTRALGLVHKRIKPSPSSSWAGSARWLHGAAPGHHARRARRRICSAHGSVAARPECVDDERVDEKLIIKCGAGSK